MNHQTTAKLLAAPRPRIVARRMLKCKDPTMTFQVGVMTERVVEPGKSPARIFNILGYGATLSDAITMSKREPEFHRNRAFAIPEEWKGVAEIL